MVGKIIKEFQQVKIDDEKNKDAFHNIAKEWQETMNISSTIIEIGIIADLR
jgi:hypothetical protein